MTASVADEALPDHPRHEVSIVHGSQLHRALGVDQIDVSSFHHQAIDRVAPGLRVTARADDGVIEALEADGFVLGMQCELHEDWRVRPEFLQVWRNFVAAAGTYAANSIGGGFDGHAVRARCELQGVDGVRGVRRGHRRSEPPARGGRHRGRLLRVAVGGRTADRQDGHARAVPARSRRTASACTRWRSPTSGHPLGTSRSGSSRKTPSTRWWPI